MRLIAVVRNGHPTVKRVMIYGTDSGYYVFHYNTLEDGPCFADSWFEGLQEAHSVCAGEYGIAAEDWSLISDPLPGCCHDLIAPTLIRTTK